VLETLATVVGLCLSVGGTFVAVSRFYANKLREIVDRQKEAALKEYAAERDFKHLQRNYEQLQIALDQVRRDIDLRLDKLEIRFTRVETLIEILGKKITGKSPSNLLDKE